MSSFKSSKATRKNSKIRLGISGPPGSGKTQAALLIAFGMVGNWSKVFSIDTENGSALLYAESKLPTEKNNVKVNEPIGEFMHIPFDPPYNPERFIEAIQYAESEGAEVIIIDSFSHEWEGVPGGCLDLAESMVESREATNAMDAWKRVKRLHKEVVQKMRFSSAHIIVCLRAEIKHEVNRNEAGKLEVRKLGLKPQQEKNTEFELTTVLDINDRHFAVATKDRTLLFMDQPPFKISTYTGEQIIKWTAEGDDPLLAVLDEIRDCDSTEGLKTIYNRYPEHRNNKDFMEALKDKKEVLIAEEPKAF